MLRRTKNNLYSEFIQNVLFNNDFSSLITVERILKYGIPKMTKKKAEKMIEDLCSANCLVYSMDGGYYFAKHFTDAIGNAISGMMKGIPGNFN